eukprot:3162096-Lingulodinium_polyedra.AAC.1
MPEPPRGRGQRADRRPQPPKEGPARRVLPGAARPIGRCPPACGRPRRPRAPVRQAPPRVGPLRGHG